MFESGFSGGHDYLRLWQCWMAASIDRLICSDIIRLSYTINQASVVHHFVAISSTSCCGEYSILSDICADIHPRNTESARMLFWWFIHSWILFLCHIHNILSRNHGPLQNTPVNVSNWSSAIGIIYPIFHKSSWIFPFHGLFSIYAMSHWLYLTPIFGMIRTIWFCFQIIFSIDAIV
jgi:hypothetical protein